MQITDSVALVTGANRGIGRALTARLRELGARKVYAASRSGEVEPRPGIVPLTLDITDPQQVAAAAREASDATLVLNNAGYSAMSTLLEGDLAQIRREMETNYFGTLHMVRAFAPVLRAQGGGAIVNTSSVMAWTGHEHSNPYGASKAANWALSNGLRHELEGTGIQVSSVLFASVDTDMMAALDVDKSDPEEIAAVILDQVSQGRLEILADDGARDLKAALSADRGVFAG